jgi:hypothetical protein
MVGAGVPPNRWRRRSLLAGRHVPVDEPPRVLAKIVVSVERPLQHLARDVLGHIARPPSAVLKAITRIAFEAIAAAAAKLKARSFTLDGEVVVAGADGVAVFDALHRRGRVTDAILHAFDLLELDGVDYRPLPLDKRKDGLANLLARARPGSRSTSTRTRTVPWCSCTPARWALKGSYRSG